MADNNNQRHRRCGWGVAIGSLFFPRPWFPTRGERAALVCQALPRWAIASGITAGWVWTGMGLPEPWSILRAPQPEISPIQRTLWRARSLRPGHTLAAIGELRLLDPASCATDILLSNTDVDVCASQILFLDARPVRALRERASSIRQSAGQRRHLVAVLDRVEALRQRYPDITR